MSEYRRSDVLRILGVREQQLRIWERNGLIACADTYSFQDLGQVRKLRDLGAQRVSAVSIRDAVHAMRSVSGLSDPLLEASLVIERSGSRRLSFRHCGAVFEPIAGQYLLDFSGLDKPALAPIGASHLSAREQEAEASRLFTLAVYAEEAGRVEEALDGYNAVLELAPSHAPSAINIGTLFYKRRDFLRAEHFYRRATESDGSYALAFFDLGNVLDEMKRMPEAIAAYERAIALQPHYADAHYNLALALERHGLRRSALEHWTIYLRLDGAGPWARHARSQLRKTLTLLDLKLVSGGATRGNDLRRKSGPRPGDAVTEHPKLRIV